MTAQVRCERQGDVLVVVLDNPPVNASTATLRRGIADAITHLGADAELTGAVLIGAGRYFVAGSDLSEFAGDIPPPVLPDVLAAIERCPKPVVAAVDGAALGGGFELALACDARIASDTATLGLPEVTLGILPGAGGTQRLPRLVGSRAALELVVTGRRIGASEALRLGVVDALVPARELRTAAVARVTTLAKRSLPDTADKLDGAAVDAILRRVARGRPLRPNVARAVELVQAAAAVPLDRGLAEERGAFDDLRRSPEAAARRHLFFAERAAARVPSATAQPAPTSAAVVGAGAMGAGIALALVEHGIDATLVDVSDDRLRAAQQQVADAPNVRAQLRCGTELADAVRGQSFVIEAIVEQLPEKLALLADLEHILAPDAVIATNTSYLDVTRLAEGMRHPERLIGLHFFNPANVMRLVEVAAGALSATTAVARGVALAKRLGKAPLVCRSAEGFVGNRIFAVYRSHVEFLLEDGALPHEVDAALTSFGFAMGPFTVADLSGLRVAWELRRRRRAGGHQSRRYVDVPDLLVAAGRTGRAVGAGYYAYPDGRHPEPDDAVRELIERESHRKGIARRSIAADEIVAGALGAMVREGAAVVREGAVATPGAVDVALVNGFGFPAWEGGPLWWAAHAPRAEVDRALALAATAAGRGPAATAADLDDVLGGVG
jgi:3-hydroxyacyl-CoA dehydrogenase